jgi:hypothetical protein
MFSVQTIDFLALYAGLEHRLVRSSSPHHPSGIRVRQNAVVYASMYLLSLFLFLSSKWF